MNELRIIDFIDRVVTSTEKVKFTQIDPYGHLNASKYSEFIINHRILAVEDNLQVATIDIAKNLGVAFVVTRLDIRYQLPCFMGEELEIASWVESLHETGFTLKVLISGSQNKKIRSLAIQEIRTVDFKTGRVVNCPAYLPTRGAVSLLKERPLKSDYVAQLKGYFDVK